MANAKVAGLVLSAYALPAGSRARRTPRHGRRGCSNGSRSCGWPNPGAWGYHFDVQLRHIYYPAHDARTRSRPASPYAACSMPPTPARPRRGHESRSRRGRFWSRCCASRSMDPFFAYVGAGSELIHNANLKVCGALARLQAHDPDPEVDEHGRRRRRDHRRAAPRGRQLALRRARRPQLARQLPHGLPARGPGAGPRSDRALRRRYSNRASATGSAPSSTRTAPRGITRTGPSRSTRTRRRRRSTRSASSPRSCRNWRRS